MDKGPDKVFHRYSQPNMTIEGEGEFKHDVSSFTFNEEAAQAMMSKQDVMADMIWSSHQ